MVDSVNTRALQLAARIAGGPAKLRKALGVRASELADWLAGLQEPPREMVLRALEIILDDLDARD